VEVCYSVPVRGFRSRRCRKNPGLGLLSKHIHFLESFDLVSQLPFSSSRSSNSYRQPEWFLDWPSNSLHRLSQVRRPLIDTRLSGDRPVPNQHTLLTNPTNGQKAMFRTAPMWLVRSDLYSCSSCPRIGDLLLCQHWTVCIWSCFHSLRANRASFPSIMRPYELSRHSVPRTSVSTSFSTMP
jgi:hypothetical protein